MKGHLHTLNAIYKRLDTALTSLTDLHTSLAVQINDLKGYVSKLSPETRTAEVINSQRSAPTLRSRRRGLKGWVS